MKTAVRRTVNAALGLQIVIVLVLVAALRFVPAVTGTTPITILTASMSPAHLLPGTIVYVDMNAPVQPGDIVSFRGPAGTILTHRVTRIEDTTGRGLPEFFRYHTKGDADAAEDSTLVGPDDVIGVVKGYTGTLIGIPASVLGGGFANQYPLSQPIAIASFVSIGIFLATARFFADRET
jgi:signal peptidase